MANSLQLGESIELTGREGIEVGGNVGRRGGQRADGTGGASATGVSITHGRTHDHGVRITRTATGVEVRITVTDTARTSGGVNATILEQGSVGVSGSRADGSGTQVSFALDPNTRDYQERLEEITELSTLTEVERYRSEHGDLIATDTRTQSHEGAATVTAGVGPLSAGFTTT